MERNENDLDVYYAVGNANTSRQENDFGELFKKELHWDGN